MQTFTIGLGHNWFIRALGRNPLTRATDRVEAIAVVLAILVALAAVPIAGAIGTSVYDTRSRTYAEQAQTRHPVAAIAAADSTALAAPNTVAFAVRATWRAADGEHKATVVRENPVKAGDRLDIWVNESGAPVDPPGSPNRAGFDAAAAAMLSWGAVVVVLAGILTVLRWSLDRRRYQQWDREIGASANGSGGRTNHQ